MGNASKSRINAFVSLTDARWVWWNTTTREAGIPAHRHKWVQGADSSTQDLLAHMSDICYFISQMASPVLSSLSSLVIEHKHDTNDEPCRAPPEAILIHCDFGISRSPTIIVAYIMRKLCMPQADVLQFVQSKQRIKPSPNFTRQLKFERRLDIKYGRTKTRQSRRHLRRHIWRIGLLSWKREGSPGMSRSRLRIFR